MKKHDFINPRLMDGDLYLHGFPNWEEQEIKKYFKSLKGYPLKDYHWIRMENFSYSSMEALKVAGLNDEIEFFEQFNYECAFNGYNHLSLVPIYIHLHDKKKLFEIFTESKAEYLSDIEYLNETINNDLLKLGMVSMSEVQSSLLGSGYTTGNYPSDGDFRKKNVVLETEQGDVIICKMLQWYNR